MLIDGVSICSLGSLSAVLPYTYFFVPYGILPHLTAFYRILLHFTAFYRLGGRYPIVERITIG